VCGNTPDHRRPESPDGTQIEPTPLSTTGRSTGMQQNTLRAQDRSTRSALALDRVVAETTTDPTGLYGPVGYVQIRRYGDPTPAVRRKPGSDVSLGSSVPPDRSRGAEHRPCNETHLVTDPRQRIVPANPQLSLRDSWTHSG